MECLPGKPVSKKMYHRIAAGVDNVQNLNAAQGAGIQAAGNVAEHGAEAVITGHVGPNAFRTLSAAGIRIYTGAEGTVAEVLEKFKASQLQEAGDAPRFRHLGSSTPRGDIMTDGFESDHGLDPTDPTDQSDDPRPAEERHSALLRASLRTPS